MNATTATVTAATASPVDAYTHTTIERDQVIHHVVAYTVGNLVDMEYTAHDFSFQQVAGVWEIREPLPIDATASVQMFVRIRAREVFQAARFMRCQSYRWCHAFCRTSQVANGMLHFCSTPEEIAAVSAVREAEDDARTAAALAAGYRLA